MQFKNFAAISISDFNYDLPDSSVAKYPLPERDKSKLLLWNKGEITDHSFSDLPGLLPVSSMLVFNNTKVIHARLHFIKSTGANIEVFCLEPTSPHDYVLSFAQTNSCRWKCIVGNKKRWKGDILEMRVDMGKEGGRDGETERRRDGETGRQREEETERRREEKLRITNYELRIADAGDGEMELSEGTNIGGDVACKDVACNVSTVVLKAELVCELEGGFEIKFSWDNSHYTFSEILEVAGNIPIPPYLHRESEEIDLKVYQTIYSKIKGSVAAPTAGLHFTDRLLKSLANRNITCEELTLHVGAGTFQPVKSDTIGEHLMHSECFSVNSDLINRLITHQGSVIAVGTTSVRTLESLYWIGSKIIQRPQIEPHQLPVTQWEPYQEAEGKIDVIVALQAILDWLLVKDLSSLETSTQIMIVPGYQFRIISGLVTNFHQPQSTLLLLISAILGDDWKKVYAHALANGYRFLSYGDANLYLI
ncbi:MAG: S-adenosylmethionine:tRNA ribosyltransferase-isomerase [Prolixibacteraceae bacterium]|jgi:S-adenosylmethionine:tRNA ribosyltransferase-isomerase|nr:S-adenosylmethionine:tRNA ribosyltransferase-isomerase [Prolixibacteraceae bacterium]